jgi:hypothetical protein
MKCPAVQTAKTSSMKRKWLGWNRRIATRHSSTTFTSDSTGDLTGQEQRKFDGAMIYGAYAEADQELVIHGMRSLTSFKKITDGVSKTFLAGETTEYQAASIAAYNGDYNWG